MVKGHSTKVSPLCCLNQLTFPKPTKYFIRLEEKLKLADVRLLVSALSDPDCLTPAGEGALYNLTELAIFSSMPSWVHEGLSEVQERIKKKTYSSAISSDRDVRDLWTKALVNANRSKNALCVLIDFLCKKTGFRNCDLSSPPWLKCLDNFMRKYAVLYPFGLATKWLKYHFAAFFAKAAGQELPTGLEGETPGSFLTGIGYCLLRMVSHSDLQSSYHVLMAKKGMAPVSPWELMVSAEDCFKNLTTKKMFRHTRVKPLDEPDYYKDPITPVLKELTNPCYNCDTIESYVTYPYPLRLAMLCHQVGRTCEELFPASGKSFSLGIPSVSSHIQSSRMEGGAFAKIAPARSFTPIRPVCVGLMDGIHANNHPRCSVREGLACREVSNDLFDGFDEDDDIEMEDRVYEDDPLYYGSQLDLIDQSTFEEIRDTKPVTSLMENYWSGLARDALSEEPEVEIQALSEPCKVRCITKGPETRYYVGRGIQKETWRVLSRHPTFFPLAGPIQIERLESRLGTLLEGESYLSGDYKAATDYLHPDLSAYAAITIAGRLGLTQKMTQIYLDGLVNSNVRDPTGGIPKYQVWGQLMGSPLSFPILCIVNAAVNRFFLELVEGHTMKLSETPMVINGDDILMRVQRNVYRWWKVMVSDAGLVPSLGKNYLSEKFVVINSTLYEVKESLWGLTNFQRRPYLNLGLICPHTEQKFIHVDPYVKDIGSCAQKAVEGFASDDQDWIVSKFLGWSKNKSLLKTLQPGISYFAAKALGGIGIPLTRPHMTRKQLQYYTWMTKMGSLLGPARPQWQEKAINLYDWVPRRLLWEDWGLEAFGPEPTTFNLLKAYGLMLDEIRRGINHGSEAIQPSLINSLWGLPHGDPWPEGSLARFPWVYNRVVEYETGESPIFTS